MSRRLRCECRRWRGCWCLGLGLGKEGLGAGSWFVSLAGEHQDKRKQDGDARDSPEHADGDLLRFAHELFSHESPMGLGLGNFARYDQQFILSRSPCVKESPMAFYDG